MVRTEGLEPSLPKETDFKSVASTGSAMSASLKRSLCATGGDLSTLELPAGFKWSGGVRRRFPASSTMADRREQKQEQHDAVERVP
jgi:hypothetical protein